MTNENLPLVPQDVHTESTTFPQDIHSEESTSNPQAINIISTSEEDTCPPLEFVKSIKNFSVQEYKVKGKSVQIHVGRMLDEIQLEMESMTGGWPRRVGERLFAIDRRQKIWWINDNPSQLAAWLSSREIQLDWRSNSKGTYVKLPAKSDLMAYLQNQSTEYDAVYDLPHFPPIPTAFYTPSASNVVARRTGAFDDLVDKFNPASPEDRALIAAFFATPFWNGGAGNNPLFVIEGPVNDPENGTGVGKTTLVSAVVALCSHDGSFISWPKTDKLNLEAGKKNIVNDNSGARVVLYDNVKASKLSSETLEELITATKITADRKYGFYSQKPNHFTYVMTFNDASLSKDLASRAVRIRLARPERYRDRDWLANVKNYIEKNRLDILSDLWWLLSQEGDDFKSSFRFTGWTHQVLGKFSRGCDMDAHLADSREDIDSDESLLSEIESAVASYVRTLWFRTPSGGQRHADPDRDHIFITAEIFTQILSAARGGPGVHRKTAGRAIRNAGDATILIPARTRSQRGIIWSPNRQLVAYEADPDIRVTEIRMQASREFSRHT